MGHGPKESMFNQIVAVDVAQRMVDFLQRVKPYSAHAPIIVKDSQELSEKEDFLGVDAILVSIYQRLNESLLNKFPNLRYIGVLGTSTKQIALKLCQEREIMVTNVTDYCDHETAEWVMLKALAFFRQQPKPKSLYDKTMGLIGLGAVGLKVLKLAKAFDMKVFFNRKNANNEALTLGAQALSKEEIFANCDVVSIHTPPFTQWLSADLLKHAKTDLCLINTCMGKISIGTDLEDVLQKRSDITYIMDNIAYASYPHLASRAVVVNESAFSTMDSQKRLADKFVDNLRHDAARNIISV